MKSCPKCGEMRELVEFARDRNRKDGLQVYCKPCNRRYRQANLNRTRANLKCWQAENRPKINEAARAARQSKSAYIAQVKDGQPCVDCGGHFPGPVMEFDHVRGEKVASVADMSRSGGYSLEKIKVEIAKCELVCANCHRIRHMNAS